jgi:hypothetical protein
MCKQFGDDFVERQVFHSYVNDFVAIEDLRK